MNRIASLLAAILLSVIGINAPAQTSTELQKLIDQADALQNNGQFEEAIAFFEQARQLCETAPGHYTPEMRYILGCLVSCTNIVGDRYLLHEYLKDLDKIAKKIGFIDEFTEYIIYLFLAQTQPDRNSTEESLYETENYIKSAGLSDDAKNDPEFYLIKDCVTRYVQSIRAYKKANEENLSILENNYRYLSTQEITDTIGDLYATDCGVMFVQTLYNLGFYKKCITEAELFFEKFPDIMATPYGLEILTVQINANEELGDFKKSIALGVSFLTKHNIEYYPFGATMPFLYDMARLYNTYYQNGSEAIKLLGRIDSNPEFVNIIQTDKNRIDSEKALAYYYLKDYTRCETICNDILSHNPDNDIRLLVNNLIANLKQADRDPLELGYIEDVESTLDDMTDNPSDADMYMDLASRYYDNYQFSKAIDAYDTAIRKFNELSDDNSYFSQQIAKIKKCSILLQLGYSDFFYFIEELSFDERFIKISKEKISGNNYQELAYILPILAEWSCNLLSLMNDYFELAKHDGSATAQQIEEANIATNLYYNTFLTAFGISNQTSEFISWLKDNNPVVLGLLYKYEAIALSSTNMESEAISLLDQALNGFDKECWMYDVLVNLKNLFYLSLGHISEMEDFILSEFDSNIKDLDVLINSFSSQQRKSMWNTYIYYIKWFIELTKDKDLPWLNGIAYNAAVVSKGLLLQADNMFEEKCRNSSDPKVTELYQQWKEISESDQKEAAKIERELVRLVQPESKKTTDFLNCKWTDVSNNLGKNEYAVEFATYLDEGLMHYIALVVGKDYKSPKLIRICDSQKINNTYKGEMTDFASLSELVWKPLSEILPKGAHVYFAPEGMLHALPLENLPDFENSGRLISDRWELRHVSSTREVANRTSDKSLKDVEIFGGMEYSFSPEAIMADYLALAPTYHRSRDIATDDLRKSTAIVEDLPGSKREVAEIARIARDGGRKVYEYAGQAATEAKFKSEAGRKGDILHISTHGFYFKPGTADFDNFGWIGQNTSDNMERALYGSGLMMAGVNETLNHNIDIEKCEDGILTAKEISMMDLSGVGTVVLSACETGVGQIFGDGVFGLQRGFKMAGARTIMMSLWKVDDNATEALMTNFYKNWFAGHDRSTALAMAQKAIRSTPGWESPRYWAGFILLDDLN